MNAIASIQLDKANDTPLYIQLCEQIEAMIVKGQLKQGERLPPIRKLSEQLKVNTVTVVNAYKLLEKREYVHSKTGSGVYIAPIKGLDMGKMSGDAVPMDEIGFFDEEIAFMSQGHIEISENSINFASATPTPDLFPVEDFKQVIVEVLDRDRGDAFGYHESNGFRDLRVSISDFIYANYGIIANENEIQIISGAQQGIDVIAKAMINPGDYVFVENPTYTGAIGVFKSRGAKIVGIPIQQDGLNMDILEKYLRIYKPRIIYTMPNYQNPTTYCYSIEKMKKLMELVNKYHVYVIEDDFLSDLNFGDVSRTHTLKSMDQYNRVLYIKSFSKVLMPGLRIGFLIAPHKVFREILQAKHTTDISSSGFIQRAFDLYLRKGIWDKHLFEMKKIYEDRYHKILNECEILEDEGVTFYKPDGGLNLWLSLPEEVSGTKLYYECAKQDLLIIPGRIFYVKDANEYDKSVRISFAAVHIEQIEKGIKIMYNCIRRLKNKTDERKTYYSPLI